MNATVGSGDAGLGPTGSSLYRRAAVWLWVIGAVQTVVFGFCSAAGALMAMVPIDQLREMTHPQQYEQMVEVYPMLWGMAIMVFVLGFMPGVVYLALGFAVRRGRGIAVNMALLLAITQCIVFGVVMVNNITVAFMQGSPGSVTINVLIVGSLLLLLAYGIRCLWSVRQFDRDKVEESDTDPWNEAEA